jgi:hypothetical protein
VSATGTIPKDHYQTWSLFLVCNANWLAPEKSDDLYTLYKRFQRFGRTIGRDQVAVWFWKSRKARHDPDLANNVDVERSVDFCTAFNLTPSEGPHLLIVSTYPDVTRARGPCVPPCAHYALGAMQPKEISELLGKLTDELVLKGRVAMQPPPQDRLWVQLLEATRKILTKFGCTWTFELNAGALKAGLRPCQSP